MMRHAVSSVSDAVSVFVDTYRRRCRRLRLGALFVCWFLLYALSSGGQQPNRQGTADLGMKNGVRSGPGMNAAAAGDYSYHNNAVPHRKRVLAWIDISNGYQHDAVSHAVSVIERLGYETGAYDTFIRSDSHEITKDTLRGSDGQPLLYGKNLNDFDAIFFFGVREIDLTQAQRRDLLSFVHDDGKGFVVAHAGATAFFSWPEFGKMLGGRFDEHPWGIVNAPVLVEDHAFPGMEHLPASFPHTDEYYQIKEFSLSNVRVLLRLDVSNLQLQGNPLIHHGGTDFPLAWAKTYGKGRVYYSALGHDPSNWDERAVQEMYYQALLWALKIKDADITPRPLMESTSAQH